MQPCAAVYPPVNSSQPPTHETHLRTDSLSNGVEPLCPGSQTCRRETRACQTCCCGTRTSQVCHSRCQTRCRARACETGDSACTCCGSSQTRDTPGGKAHHTGSSTCGQGSCEACACHTGKARSQARGSRCQACPTSATAQAGRGFQRQGARNSRAEAGLRQA